MTDNNIQKIVLPGQAPDGQYILSVILKRSYNIIAEGRCVRAESDQKLFPGDIHFEDPMNSTVRFEADFVPYKIATDVVLNGKAYAPHGEPIHSLVASLLVDRLRKDILIIGDRVCRYKRLGGIEFTDPQAFVTMELRYENSYGGVDIRSDPNLPSMYPRNHLGKGFIIGKSKSAIDNLPLPNIEDPDNMLSPDMISTGHFMYWEKQPAPQGFGWFSKCWQPRASFAGVMPADRQTEKEMREAYTNVVPPEQRKLYEQTQLPDMDFRFFNGASHGLVLPFLSGNEKIQTINLSPEREIYFWLPGEHPRIGLDVGTGLSEPEVVLQTVMIRMEDRQVDLVWRGAVPYPGPDWLPEMKKMDVSVD